LIEYGVEQQVLIATPMTLIGLLRAIHYGWRQELIAESAREIAEIGRELHKRMCTFAEPLRKLGRGLSSANDAYNNAVASFDSRVVPQLRKIEAAGASSGRDLPALEPIEATPRPITSGLESGDEQPDTVALATGPGLIEPGISGEDLAAA
jgi:DNA recombination protein RmuC